MHIQTQSPRFSGNYYFKVSPDLKDQIHNNRSFVDNHLRTGLDAKNMRDTTFLYDADTRTLAIKTPGDTNTARGTYDDYNILRSIADILDTKALGGSESFLARAGVEKLFRKALTVVARETGQNLFIASEQRTIDMTY